MQLLENIKIAVFDFDDTLAMHVDKDYRTHRKENSNEYFINAYKYPKDFYEKIEPCTVSKAMKTLVENCRVKNIPMYCVSGMRFSIHLDAKKEFVHNHYGNDIKVFAASSQERKTDVVSVLSDIHNCSNKEILFVDDLEENISRMKKLGICALMPNDVEELIIKE